MLVNAAADAAGGIRARPGIRAWDGFPTSIPAAGVVTKMAVYGDRLIYVVEQEDGDRKVLAWVSSGTVLDLSLAGGTALVDGTDKPSIAVGRELCVIAGGGAPQKVTSGLSSSRLGGSPPLARDVVYFNNYVVIAAADASGIIYWAGPGEADAETWSTSRDFLEAESEPDELVGLSATAGMLFLYGTDTVQTYVPDPDEVFASQNTLKVGMKSKDSLIRRGDTFYWLDNHDRIVAWDGHSWSEDESVISAPAIESVLKGLSSTSDCWGFRCDDGVQDLLVWVFPTDGRTFAYDARARRWSEWYAFVNGRWAAWAPTAFVHWHEMGLMLVGLDDGSIAELSRDAYTDLGEPLQWVARSGFSDRGDPGLRKLADHVTIVMRRGNATADDNLRLRWRNDLGGWRGNITLALGSPGDYNPVLRPGPCGSYFTRQWELSGSAAAATMVAKALETFEVEAP